MQGPWKEGTPEQGYQLNLTPAQRSIASVFKALMILRAHVREIE
jgi:hypothetical protein